MRTVLAAAAGIAIAMAASAGSAQTVYPIDRADILSGARFDFKVEFAGLADPAKISITLNGKDYAQVFGKAATFVEREAGKDQSALTPARCLARSDAGDLQRPRHRRRLRPANLAGTSMIPRRARRRTSSCSSATACRSRIASRRECWRRALRRGRRSASSPSTTCRRWPWSRPPAAIRSSPTRRIPPALMRPATKRRSMPWGSMPTARPTRSTIRRSRPSPAWRKRSQDMAVGIVTNTEVEDATPAAMVAHTRRRSEYDRIVEQYLRGKARRHHGRRPCQLPAEIGGTARNARMNPISSANFATAGYSRALRPARK